MAVKILELKRKVLTWKCSECGKTYAKIPAQCVCGATANVFDEESNGFIEGDRKVYDVVKGNIIYEGQHVKKGTVVSLVAKDSVTRNLLKREFLLEIKEK